jgi:hypothetical protein
MVSAPVKKEFISLPLPLAPSQFHKEHAQLLMESLQPEALELRDGKSRLGEIYQQAAFLETASSVKRTSHKEEDKPDLTSENMDTDPTRASFHADVHSRISPGANATSPAKDSLETLLSEHVKELKTHVADSETLRKRMFGEVEAIQQERRVKDAHFQKTLASITDIADVELPSGL